MDHPARSFRADSPLRVSFHFIQALGGGGVFFWGEEEGEGWPKRRPQGNRAVGRTAGLADGDAPTPLSLPSPRLHSSTPATAA